MRAHIDLVALVGPSQSAQFEFHLTDWFGGTTVNALPILPEVRKIEGNKLLCLFGKEKEGSLCPSLDPSLAEVIPFAGSHHFGGD